MSEWHVRVVEIGKVGKHPNADRLEITHVDNYPVVIGAGSFQPGDLAVYIPVDSVLPNEPEFEAVYKYTAKGRVKAAKLRGIFSMGILHTRDYPFLPQPDGVTLAEWLGITKYEPPAEIIMGGDALPDDGKLPKYTDIEGLRRYPHILEEGEVVVVTEKLHGACARFGWIDGEFYVGSKNQRLDPAGNNAWSRAAREIELADRLLAANFQNHIFFGELLGVQDLKYGHANGALSLRFFDVFNLHDGQYLDYLDFMETMQQVGLDLVPIIGNQLHRYSSDLAYAAAEGLSLLADHVREGVVIKPTVERWHPEVGRVILKLAGEGYLTR